MASDEISCLDREQSRSYSEQSGVPSKMTAQAYHRAEPLVHRTARDADVTAQTVPNARSHDRVRPYRGLAGAGTLRPPESRPGSRLVRSRGFASLRADRLR